MVLVVATSRSWKRKMFVGVQRGFQAVRNVLIFNLDGEYITVWFIIILHTTCLYFIHVCIHFHSLKQKKKSFKLGIFFRHHIIFKVFLYKGFTVGCLLGLVLTVLTARLQGISWDQPQTSRCQP